MYQKTLSIPFDNLSFVGQGERETIVDGGFVVENGRKVSFEDLTVKNLSVYGLYASGADKRCMASMVVWKKKKKNPAGDLRFRLSYANCGAKYYYTCSQFYLQNEHQHVYYMNAHTCRECEYRVPFKITLA